MIFGKTNAQQNPPLIPPLVKGGWPARHASKARRAGDFRACIAGTVALLLPLRGALSSWLIDQGHQVCWRIVH